ncbi:hypothetical protein FRC02_002738, partial [Tulasnella sp. 418]
MTLTKFPVNFEQLCSFAAKIPKAALIEEKRAGAKGGASCWRCYFDAVVSFGTTEFKCHIEWKDRQ